MSGDGTEFEYPDQAGYPDGMGTLHEGTEDEADGDGDGDGDDEDGDDEDGDDPDGFEAGLAHFAMQDEEDVDEDV
jgi:hypothetical protein